MLSRMMMRRMGGRRRRFIDRRRQVREGQRKIWYFSEDHEESGSFVQCIMLQRAVTESVLEGLH